MNQGTVNGDEDAGGEILADFVEGPARVASLMTLAGRADHQSPVG